MTRAACNALVFSIMMCFSAFVQSSENLIEFLRLYLSSTVYAPALKDGGMTLDEIINLNVRVNRSISYASDLDNFGKVDYWRTPRETLLFNSSDCEEYAMIKYFILLSNGVYSSRLAYVRVLDVDRKEVMYSHLVTIVSVDGADYVLDNQIDTVRSVRMRPDMRIISEFDESGFIVGRVSGDYDVVVNFRKVLDRMRSNK